MESRHKGLEIMDIGVCYAPTGSGSYRAPPNNAFISKTIKYPLHIHTPVGYYVKQV